MLCKLSAPKPWSSSPNAAPAALAAALQAVLADPDAARTRADAAYTNLCAHFTWQAVFATMEKTAAQAAKRS